MQLRRKILLNAFKISDLILLCVAFSIVTWSLYGYGTNISLNQFLTIRIKIENVALIGGFALVWHIIFSGFELYTSRRLSTLGRESLDILKATSIGTLVLATAKVLFDIQMVTQEFILGFWMVSTGLIVSSRLLLRPILKRVRVYGRNLRNVLIVGTNPRAVRFAQDIQSKPGLGYNLIGFMDEDWPGLQNFQKKGFSVVTNFKNFASFLRCFVIDEVVLALPLRSYYQQAAQIVEQCEEQGILIRILGNVFTPKLARENLEEFGNHSLLTFQPGAIGDRAFLLKRIIDVTLSLPSILIFSPLLLSAAIAIKMSSPGAVFFVQNRVGFNKRKFRLIKFRTMVPGAESMIGDLDHLNEVNGAAFKIQDDPRLTPVGKFLRKTSIDELPQLFNVLKGDMSLVGPRPLPIRDFEEFTEDWHRRRFSVPPGMTCLWQVNGRSQLPFEKWMELDMQYIDQWTLWLDFKILFKTIPVVLRGTGAS